MFRIRLGAEITGELRRTLDLQLGGGFHRGEPQFRAALVRRF